MKKLHFVFIYLFLFQFCFTNAQSKPSTQKIKISGIVSEKISKLPLEYAIISFVNPKNAKATAGGITDAKGEFNIEINPGVYDIKIEFISFKALEIKNKNLKENTSLGQIFLEEDAAQLNEVVVRADKSIVEIKLDKKVYSVGKDLMVKGGSISDVLENIPSVSVDQDGLVSLRGNENVKILIDGKPTNAVNIAEVLRTISAESIDKVEVITNPSARYDSEGSAGILNIIIKKGKNQGLNGSVVGTLGEPKNNSISANVNYKTEKANFYTILSTINRDSPGNSINNTQYLNSDGTTSKYIDETTERSRISEGYNAIFGIDWDINDHLNWTNSISYRNTDGNSLQTAEYVNYNANGEYSQTDYRTSDVYNEREEFEYTTNLIQKFKKEGHKITLLGTVSNELDNDNTTISSSTIENTTNDQSQNNNLVQLDYVLPINETDQFEAGFRGSYKDFTSNSSIDSLDVNGDIIGLNSIKSIFQYQENISAFYAQYGKKYKKLSALVGLRWEASNLHINELTTQDLNQKTYNNFFPSLILNYELSEDSNAGISYSKRINRPRDRFINPFTNYTSNINIFRGNPFLDPSITNAINLQYYKKWNKLTLDTSMYYNITTDAFQFVRLETGRYVFLTPGDTSSLTPVILTTPINLAKEYRFGYEFTLVYTPFKWWRLNGNFNIYSNLLQGDYTYTDFEGNEVYQNFDTNTYGWTTRLNSRISLPYKIDFVTNTNYNGAQKTIQGNAIGVFSANVSITKDFLKDKATIALNIQDILNSRKRISETYVPGVFNSYNEFQGRERQINLSLTYRFNKNKNDKEKQPKGGGTEDGGGEFPG